MPNLRWVTPRALERILRQSWHRTIALAEEADSHYHESQLETGGKTRPLLIPRRGLKIVQKRLRRQVFQTIPPHDAAYCVRGRGALEAARKHSRRAYLYHRDVKSFYPSVTPDHVMQALLRLKLEPAVASVLVRLVTTRDHLPQGASTSPAVAELILFPIDRRITNLASGSLTYTRYADDMAISGGAKRLKWAEKRVPAIVQEFGLRLNDKGGLFGPDQRHVILGIVVNGEPNVSPGYAEDVRRIFRLVLEGKVSLSESQLRSMAGKVHWIRAVNPKKGVALLKLLREVEIRNRTIEPAVVAPAGASATDD